MNFNRLFILIFCHVSIWTGINASNSRVSDSLFYSTLESEQYHFKHINTEDGLSQSSVVSILKDSYGFLWFGTYNGLCMYNAHDFKTYTYHDNDTLSISNNMVWSLCEDAEKNIWAGTYGGGANKLDIKTETFIRYQHSLNDTNSIGGNIIRAILHTKDSTLCLATENGLSIYNKATDNFTNYRLFNAIADNTALSLFEDSNNQLWIGTNSGVVLFDLNERAVIRRYIESIDGINHAAVVTIAEDKDNNLWFGTWGNGLNFLNTKTNKFKNYNTKNSEIASNTIMSIVFDNRYRLWIGTRGSGISIFNIQKDIFRTIRDEFNNPKGLSSNSIFNIYIDNTDLIWVGTDFGGVNIFNQNSFQFRSHRYDASSSSKLHAQLPTFLYEDSKCNLWIAGRGGCSVYNRKQNTTEFLPFLYNNQLFESGSICGIDEDSNKNIWIISDGAGVMKYSPSTGIRKYYTVENKNIGTNYIFNLYIDKQNNIWLGTLFSGLMKYNDKYDLFENVVIRKDNQDVKICCRSLSGDSYGNLIIGSECNGLIFYNPLTLETKIFEPSKERNNAISGNLINVIFEDSDSVLWIGTMDNGLNKFDRYYESFLHFNKTNNMSSNRIYGIQEDNDGNLWISTDNGLNKFDKEKGEFFNFYETDGILNNEFLLRSYEKSKSTELLFGTRNGIVIFEPEEIIQKKYSMPIFFTKLKIFNETINPGVFVDERLILSKPLRLTDTLYFNYTDKLFSIDYSGLNYYSSNFNNYSYKLEGFNENWNNIENNYSTAFTNLNPGKYKLRIKYVDINKHISAENSIVIIMRPPFWSTWWFRITTITIFILSIYMGYRFRVRNLNKQRELLEQTVAFRTKEIAKINTELLYKTDALASANITLKKRQTFIEVQSQELKEQKRKLERINVSLEKSNETKKRLISILSHDLRGPFSSIMGFADLLVKRIHLLDNEKIQQFASNIFNSSQKVLDLLETMLLWAKMQQEAIIPDFQSNNIDNLITDTINLLDDSLKHKNITIQNNAGISIPAMIDKNMFITIIRNLLSNAIKFTPIGGRIFISTEQTEYDVYVSIKDTGVGMSPEIKDKVLISESVTSLGTNNEKGTGLGLLLAQDFVKVHKGKLWFESEFGKGTTFHVRLPLFQNITNNR